ncbi:MAG: hypothetical protein AAF752_13525 [Bacteroidota bacterium]
MATTSERSINEQLKALIRLQHIDTQLDQLDKLRGDLPDEIRDLEDERAGLETRIERYRQEAQEGIIEARQAELDMKESEEAIDRYSKQQLQVRNNREYDALTKEIEAHKQRIIESTDKLETIKVRNEAQADAVDAAQARLDELNAIIGEKRGELDVTINETAEEQGGLETNREKVLETIDERYRKAYTRLRGRLRDGRAVVPLVRGAAGGFAVPPQQQVEVRQANRIVICEHTGRIIVDKALTEETIAAM